MQSFLRFWPRWGRAFPCAAILLAGLFASGLAAQQATGAPAVPSAPPQPPVFQNPIPSTQLAFLSSYAGQPVKLLRKNKQFRAVMKLAVPRTEYHYGWDMPLSDAIDEMLDGSTLPVTVVDGRYVFIAGHNGPYLHGRGFMWFDIEQGDALGVFYFQPTNGEPTPTLTVFSRQLTGTSLGMSDLPAAFGEALNQWAMATHAPVVSPTYFIPENGKKYVLLHDMDFCSGQAPSATATGPSVCEQLDANAADDDMNAAYFMKETHNAANATAWMLGPGQVAWISLRQRACGIGLPCRIAMTRERTRVLIGRPAPEPRMPNPGPRPR
jgi:uncharacterized protein YecT (DUF1311 family)